MGYINSGVFNGGELKYDLHFHFRIPPAMGRAQGGMDRLGEARGGGGVESYTTKNHVLCYFWGFNSGEFKNDMHFHFRVPLPRKAPQGGGGGG